LSCPPHPRQQLVHGSNPDTGEAVTIKASKNIASRPAKALKEAI
jgi:nucleoid DNA-binding protein